MAIEDHKKPAVYGESALDLFQAAWSLGDAVYEQLLGVDAGWLHAWRNHEVPLIMKPVWERFNELLRLHDAVRLHSTPQRYGDFVSRAWREDSFLGETSIIQAVIDEGGEAIDRIAKYLWAVAAGN